ncbi:iron-containing alcohol dehydrogenase [Streptomyces sp. adm13(2018)]|uniref:sedoheptulose 7-phosphate cyclase n=1 Tax=unclassified Streptomyces TaxID=2593676 RepID=UPI0011CDF657|nr:sedoheptulose 7-phosphate cyclase [Streptomyces sp. adm13(2018)]TXS07821.1 iron-containing alcohol dehydrogenase [Streptomyces sp. adm13(2018)]
MSLGQWTVHAHQSVSYRVAEAPGLLAPTDGALARAARLTPGTRRLVVIDERVLALHGDRIHAYFRAREAVPHVLALSGGESGKELAAVERVVRAADAVGLDRRDPIVAIGGGVLTDLVGLAASLYRRGTPFVRVPTTLVGMIDAAVGAKTAVNAHGHKNRLGTYHPAADTLVDRSFLRTLGPRHIRNGVAEIVKMAVIDDPVLFDLLDAHAETLVDTRMAGPEGGEVMRRAITAMLAHLEPNLWEKDLCRAVDFGHTFGPALEMVLQPALLHGEAVSLDMALSCAISVDQGLLSPADAVRVLRLLERIGLPVRHERCTPVFLAEALAESTRHRDGHQHLPLPAGIGKCVFAEDLTPDGLARAVELLDRLLVGAEGAAA